MLPRRLSDSNMVSITNHIETLYREQSRADMNTSLRELASELVLTDILTPERLSMELAMLIAILHNNIGTEIGESRSVWSLSTSWVAECEIRLSIALHPNVEYLRLRGRARHNGQCPGQCRLAQSMKIKSVVDGNYMSNEHGNWV